MGDTFTEIIEKLSKDISKNNTSLCIGTFDGVHSCLLYTSDAADE